MPLVYSELRARDCLSFPFQWTFKNRGLLHGVEMLWNECHKNCNLDTPHVHIKL